MRAIKFRMWDKHDKKMYQVGKINFDNEIACMRNSQYYTSSLKSFDEIELMQYTGLKDKNGKEIYERRPHKN